jgi:catechol 2,3-dioxygenase
VTTDTLPAETTVGRVALRVADLDQLVEFYTAVVGLSVLDRAAGSATLGAGGTPLLELVAAPDLPARAGAAAGLFHTAFRVPDRTALGDALGRIEREWRLTGASDHRVSEALYLRDPEDNGVEIYCDRPRSEWPRQGERVGIDTLPLDLDPLREAARGEASVPDGTDVGHVHLEVSDLAAAREFYVGALGMGLRQEVEGALFVAAGDYHHHVGLNVWNGRTDPAAGRGLAWFELLVPDADALAATRERLADAGYEEDNSLEGNNSDVTYEGDIFHDRDGIEVRLRVA